jgi:hypothetical protein
VVSDDGDDAILRRFGQLIRATKVLPNFGLNHDIFVVKLTKAAHFSFFTKSPKCRSRESSFDRYFWGPEILCTLVQSWVAT